MASYRADYTHVSRTAYSRIPHDAQYCFEANSDQQAIERAICFLRDECPEGTKLAIVWQDNPCYRLVYK